jgi:hypothetical protein
MVEVGNICIERAGAIVLGRSMLNSPLKRFEIRTSQPDPLISSEAMRKELQAAMPKVQLITDQ